MVDSSKFEIEVIASGDFIDNDPSFRGKAYRVATRTIRLNPVALDEYSDSIERTPDDWFDSREEYEAYAAEKRTRRAAFEKKVAAALGFDHEVPGVTVQRVISEIFAVVCIAEEK